MPEHGLIDLSSDAAQKRALNGSFHGFPQALRDREVLILWRGKVPATYCSVVDEYSGADILQLTEVMEYVKNKASTTSPFSTTTALDSAAVREAAAGRPSTKTGTCGSQPRHVAFAPKSSSQVTHSMPSRPGAQPEVLYRGNHSITVTPQTRDMETTMQPHLAILLSRKLFAHPMQIIASYVGIRRCTICEEGAAVLVRDDEHLWQWWCMTCALSFLPDDAWRSGSIHCSTNTANAGSSAHASLERGVRRN